MKTAAIHDYLYRAATSRPTGQLRIWPGPGHISQKMKDRYAHIRMDVKRQAVDQRSESPFA